MDACGVCIPGAQRPLKECFSLEKTIIIVVIYNQQFQGAISKWSVFDFEGTYTFT